MRRKLSARWLGRRRYEPVHQLMQELHAARREDAVPDTVLFVEHDPVITLGRGADRGNVLLTHELLAARGVDLIDTGRGGDVTLHAPGQLVCYPIVNLSPDRRDVRRYVGDLAETMRRLAATFGIDSGPVKDLVGIWVDADEPQHWAGPEQARRMAKLGAIGVRISRWVTMHGFAFNLSTDLALFGLIVPCGISSHGVTSVRALTGAAPTPAEAVRPALEHLARVLDADVEGLTDESGVKPSTRVAGLGGPLSHE